MGKNSKKHLLREETIKKVLDDHLGEALTCVALFELINEELSGKLKLSNSKQLGFYLKKVVNQDEALIVEKKVFFLNPSSSLVKYVFHRACDDTVDEIIYQDILMSKKEKEEVLK